MDKYTRIRRYRNVLKLREDGMSFEAIAKRYGRSRQRIWQIHAEAMAWSALARSLKSESGLRIVAEADVDTGAEVEQTAKEPEQVRETAEKGDSQKRRKRFVGFGRFRLNRA